MASPVRKDEDQIPPSKELYPTEHVQLEHDGALPSQVPGNKAGMNIVQNPLKVCYLPSARDLVASLYLSLIY